ncbi:uncharacterized protein PFL1_03287 [Pseudozyma flocculosa PF-1]|uniref:RNA polymerase II subunit A C-terminal domain phosphatase n=2 Tax=Pseudozyma flocculosa TaxID=84751 RepID=A0A5C3F740_9BASI|nr:uncharacterized protein PFL1_03287 [Pseudozyma flocculosa PF-1]EPQ28997.1 hypothetical protein PFL1_03287 [Pseudozyma flocculosa PF-1]SPO39990.1 related to FCP1 - TFIIF interacting component of CTD phosphatase [Pseudozyma flocculosa]
MADTDPCQHPVQVAGMCAVCGKALDGDALSNTSLPLMHFHAGVKVSEQEARRLDSETTTHLLAHRKLALVVDLDQTIIHATVDPTVGDWMRDESNPNFHALSDVGIFKLGIDGKAASGVAVGDAVRQTIHAAAADDDAAGCWYYVKPRPGLDSFLRSLSQRYELHVYTMGTRSYADCVCRLVDPDGSFFGNRILSRDENGSLVQKSLSRLFPVDTSMVVIIDDRADVWKWSPNLVKVVPYDFFVGIGDINATFLPPAPALPGTAAAASIEPPTASAAAKTPSPDSWPTSSSSSSPSSSTASPSSTAPTPGAAATSAPAGELPKPTESASKDETADDEAKPSKEAVALLAAQSQKLEEILSEQRQERPLAKMQEALNEKIGATTSTDLDAGHSQANGEGQQSSPPVAAEAKAQPAAPQEGNLATSSASTPSNPLPGAEGTASAQVHQTGTADSAASNAGAGTAVPPTAVPQAAVLRDDDTELQRIQTILDDLHSQWYARYDSAKGDASGRPSHESKKPTVTDLIAARKAEVLKGCYVSFSGMIPSNVPPKTADIWRVAEEYGARCITNLTASVTHVVAARPGTVKAMRALSRPGISVVWPGWLHDSIAQWKRRPESWYLLPALDGDAKEAHARDGWDDPLEGEPGSANLVSEPESGDVDGEDQEDETGTMPGFAEMDWAEAADEVDQFLDDDDSEADMDSELDSEVDDDRNRANDSGPSTPRKDKRQRPDFALDNGSVGDDDGDDNDENEASGSSLLLRSPLSKRRKRAEDRMGKSKLKQSLTGDELAGSAGGANDDDGAGGGSGSGTADEGEHKDGGPRQARATNGGRRSRDGDEEGATDTGSIDESFLDDLANEIDLQMDEDADGEAASHSDDD